MSDVKPQIQEAQRTLSKINAKTVTAKTCTQACCIQTTENQR